MSTNFDVPNGFIVDDKLLSPPVAHILATPADVPDKRRSEASADVRYEYDATFGAPLNPKE